MKTTSLVVGIVGGVLGILATLLVMAGAGVGEAVDAKNTGSLFVQGLIGFALAVVGIVGGAVAGRSAGWSSLLLLVASVGGAVAVGGFWLLSGPLFLVGALTSFLAWRRDRRRVAVAA